MKNSFLIIALILFLTAAFSASADTLGDQRKFYVDSDYDFSGRKEIFAVLIKKTSNIYFYADRDWWNFVFQEDVLASLNDLASEFENKIHPVLTSVYGDEPNPGVDGDHALMVLIHPMKKSAGGYFRSIDEYSKILAPDSNEREILYLNSDNITKSIAKSLLAHEFTHLITFNQKENKNNVSEEIWLNELRAEYAPTLLGYDDAEGSNLKNRIQDFNENPSESLIEWKGTKSNYGSINLFAQYLADHYGVEVLADSLQSKFIGIDSLNYALAENKFKETLSRIFIDWTIATLINDCNYGEDYCYLNPNLKNFHVIPSINFLPVSGESTLTFSDVTSQWAGNWYKIIGGKGTLNFKFYGSKEADFLIPYIAQNKSGGYIVNFLSLDSENKGYVVINNFGEDVVSLYFITSILKTDEGKPFYSFSWSASIKKNPDDPEIINSLLERIAKLKSQIAAIQAQIAAANGETNFQICKINGTLSFGQKSESVRCLQEFLKSQGPGIYPEGAVTGYFGSLTRAAVIRFQEKYASEILKPLGLLAGTGYVGSSTRAKINQLLTI